MGRRHIPWVVGLRIAPRGDTRTCAEVADEFPGCLRILGPARDTEVAPGHVHALATIDRGQGRDPPFHSRDVLLYLTDHPDDGHLHGHLSLEAGASRPGLKPAAPPVH